MRTITQDGIRAFGEYLAGEEKSGATLVRYLHDLEVFRQWMGGNPVGKDAILSYKAALVKRYSVASVNSILSSLNSFFRFQGWDDLCVRALRVQKQLFSQNDRELSQAEYKRLLAAAQARKNERLYLLIQTICSTGIRVSEVRFITVAAIRSEVAEVDNKGKRRRVYLPRDLCRLLNDYCRRKGLTSGPVFITRGGNPLDRSNIWSDMKKLCQTACVSAKKVFPHNLRHLFARTVYNLRKDIVRLADILGHSSVNTTRIYTMESGEIHRKQIQKLGLLRC